MNRITGLLLALVMAFSTMVMIAPPASADVNCGRVKTAIRTTDHLSVSHMRIKIYYKTCTNGKQRWVRLISATGSYVHERGSDLNCGWEQIFEGSRFTLKVQDNRGNSLSRVWEVGCQESGRAQKTIKLGNAPKLYFMNGSPTWSMRGTEMMSWGVPDRHDTVGGRFIR